VNVVSATRSKLSPETRNSAICPPIPLGLLIGGASDTTKKIGRPSSVAQEWQNSANSDQLSSPKTMVVTLELFSGQSLVAYLDDGSRSAFSKAAMRNAAD
jgi:hypothetical protein